MNFNIVTLFPEMFESVINSSILKRAQEKKILHVQLVNLREFGIGAHKTVDDKPYGGGVGMVLRIDVLHKAIQFVKKQSPKTKVILMDPRGIPLTQELSERLAKLKDITLICGHYEGFDERVRRYIDMEISLGDFVLTGGEIPALAVIDSVARLVPGVLGKEESHRHESFSQKNKQRILENPHYTRPFEYDGKSVPKVLLSGDQAKVEAYRTKEAKKITKMTRPDLLDPTEAH